MPAPTTVATPTDTRHASTQRGATSATDPRTAPEDVPRARRAKRKAQARGAGPQGPALGNRAKSTATAGQSDDGDRRADRYRARAWLSTVRTDQHQRRWRNCGKASKQPDGMVLLKAAIGKDPKMYSAGYGGLTSCGSVWACPVCSAKIAAQRTQELERLLKWNAERGGTVALATFTMSHHQGQRLQALRKALTKAWSHVTDSRAWKKERKALGMDGYVRAIECTDTSQTTGNGWHLHIHVLMLFDGPVPQEAVDEFSDRLYEVWSRGLAKSDMTASREKGVDVRQGSNALDGLGKYLSKLVYETAGGRWKKKRDKPNAGRTPFELLDDALTSGNADDWARWFEWERGTKGMQQLVWSDGLKDRAKLEDVSDEEAAEAEVDGEVVATIPPNTWQQLYWHAADLLTVTEHGGPQAAYDWLTSHGYAYTRGELSYGDSA